jgi:inosine-uridine nucleoside N-ribohydrolase
MTAERQPFILDVDTGIDDAAAIALAVNTPEVELLAVTTVAGNVDIKQTTENTLRVLDWLGAASVPVHYGASRPLAKAHQNAAHVHGTNGLGGVELPPSTTSTGRDRGPAAVIRMANERPGEITLVCTGPLTNLAIALNVEPSLPSKLKKLVIMGGAFFYPGNITQHAEFNIYVDPEAAEQIFAAPFADVTAVGLDASHQARLIRANWESAERASGRAAQLLHKIYGRSFVERELPHGYLHDPLAFAIAVDPMLATYATGAIRVELDGERRGKTTLKAGTGAAKVADGIDAERFFAIFSERLGISS